MGGSKSSSSQASEVTTNNLSLDGVDGVTVAGEGNKVIMTDPGIMDFAYNTVSGLYEYLEESQRQAVQSVSDNALVSLATVSDNAMASLDRMNESNRSENDRLWSNVITITAIIAGAATLPKLLGKK